MNLYGSDIGFAKEGKKVQNGLLEELGYHDCWARVSVTSK
jgi:hypothetical protein